MSDVKNNWPVSSLGSIANIKSGGTPSRSKKEYWGGKIPWVKISDISTEYISETEEFITEDGLKNSSANLFPKGTILFTIFATIGKVGILNINATTNQAIAGITPNEDVVNSKFLTYSLRELAISLEKQGKGVAQKNINLTILKETKIPLPPLPEQQRIVAKLDSFFAHLEQVKQRMEQIPVLLKQFRQAVLTQAVTGKLTEGWREGKELEKFTIDEIDIFRKVLKSNFSIEQGKKSFTYRKASIPKLGENTKGIDVLFVLDKNWNWVNLDMVTWNISDGPHFSPKYVSSEIGKRFISMRNITSKGIDFNDCKFVSKSDHLEFIKRGKPEKGDILYSKGGTTGIPCLVDSDTDFSYWVHVALLKPISKVIDSRYLKFTLESQLCYNQSQAFTHGVGNQDLGLTRMTNICFPLPPLQEQTEIVRRVEALFTKADAIEAQYKKLKEQIEQLPQAILAKAFRGEM